MNTAERVRRIACSYYEKPNRVINWNEWVWHGHNEVVAAWVDKIAQSHEFDVEAVKIAAYLHDLAYAWTDKNDSEEERQSLDEARMILEKEGFEPKRISLIVDGIIEGHGMHSGEKPALTESQVLATADAMAHLTTDFYLVICWNHYLFEGKTLSDYKVWVMKKIERDFNSKIFFDDMREIARPYYKSLERMFGTDNGESAK